MTTVLLFAMVLGLMLIGVPIAVALGLSSMIFLMMHSDASLASVAQTLFSAFDGHYTLLAIPFFVLAAWRSAFSILRWPWSGTSKVAWPLPRCLPA